MGNCSSTGAKFPSHSRFFKVTIIDSDCTVGKSSKELGCGNLEVTKFELVLHQNGFQSIRWPYWSLLKYSYKGDIFIIEIKTLDIKKPIEKRHFIAKGANILHRFIQSQITHNSNSENAKKEKSVSKSDDGHAQPVNEGFAYGPQFCHNRIWSHPELDLAVKHPHHPPGQYCCCNTGQRVPPIQQHQPAPYMNYPYILPPSDFVNMPLPQNRMMGPWPQYPQQPLATWQEEECHGRESDRLRENTRHKVSRALKKNLIQQLDRKNLKNFALQRNLEVLDLDTSNITSCMNDDMNEVYAC